MMISPWPSPQEKNVELAMAVPNVPMPRGAADPNRSGMMSEKRNKIAIEMVRLSNFLDANQLVQANAVAQKVESIVVEQIQADSKDKKAEDHPWWNLMRRVHVVKDSILKGRTKDAGEALAAAKAEIGML